MARDRSTAPGSRLGPFIDPVHGTVSIAILVRHGNPEDPVASAIANAKVSPDAVRRWAIARASERALTDRLLAGWRTNPQPQSRAAELVIGPADVQGRSGSFVSFAHLVVDRLPGDISPPAGAGRAERLVAELTTMARTEREARFLTLMDAANQMPTDDPLRTSGELGYFTKGELIPELSRVAFGDGVVDGTILGPITTAAGSELYIVRSHFSGSLDERSDAALVAARSSQDFVALSRRISPPGEIDRARAGPWRVEGELVGSRAARDALFATPIHSLSDPFVLDGQLVIARPIERRRTKVEPATFDRLTVRGWTAWLLAERQGAVVVVDPEPLPGVSGPTPTPTGSESPSGLETPFLPIFPGATIKPSDGQPGLPSFQVSP